MVLAAAMLLATAGATRAAGASGEAERGRKLFSGAEVVAARLAGHAAALPPSLGACVNCHGARPSALEARAAPALGCTALREARPRRGGPAVAYDRDSFCRTLRTGIDPNYVVLARAMPRFEAGQAQCDALWAYLTTDQEACDDAK